MHSVITCSLMIYVNSTIELTPADTSKHFDRNWKSVRNTSHMLLITFEPFIQFISLVLLYFICRYVTRSVCIQKKKRQKILSENLKRVGGATVLNSEFSEF